MRRVYHPSSEESEQPVQVPYCMRLDDQCCRFSPIRGLGLPLGMHLLPPEGSASLAMPAVAYAPASDAMGVSGLGLMPGVCKSIP